MPHAQSHTILHYLAWIAGLNLVWEFAHMPLYTLWTEGTAETIIFAAIHCTVGDVLIAAGALGVAWLAAGSPPWPTTQYWRVAGFAIVAGLAYTVFSEWHNVFAVRSWAYAPAMPVVFSFGLSPLLQWLIVPLAAFALVRT